jgi:hypothetical protein
MESRQENSQETLLTICKLLLDEDRLKILGLLAQQPCSAEGLTAQLKVARVKLQLDKLEAGRLIHKSSAPDAEHYALDREAIVQLKKQLFARTESPESQSTEEQELAKFVKAGQLQQLPVQPAKLLVVLRWLVDKFQFGVEYTERDVNERLKGHTVDHVTLRRLLIDHQLLARHAGIYWRMMTMQPASLEEIP